MMMETTIETARPNLIDQTLKFLSALDIAPDFVNPSQEGDSTIIEFTVREKYYMVEVYDDGDIVLLTHDKGVNRVHVWDLTSDNYLQKLTQQLA